MKKILAILILIFTLQTPSQADDIQDFQIEGMSVGDSLLDYYDKERLKKIKIKNNFKTKIHNKYCDYLGSLYFDVCFYTLTKDKEYKIESIAGFIDCKKSIKACYKKQKEIDKEIKSLFSDSVREVYDYKHGGDKTGNTEERDIIYTLKSKAEVGIAVLDYGKEKEEAGNEDHLQVFADSKDYARFLREDAW
jgi:hypothetical protein